MQKVFNKILFRDKKYTYKYIANNSRQFTFQSILYSKFIKRQYCSKSKDINYLNMDKSIQEKLQNLLNDKNLPFNDISLSDNFYRVLNTRMKNTKNEPIKKIKAITLDITGTLINFDRDIGLAYFQCLEHFDKSLYSKTDISSHDVNKSMYYLR